MSCAFVAHFLTLGIAMSFSLICAAFISAFFPSTTEKEEDASENLVAVSNLLESILSTVVTLISNVLIFLIRILYPLFPFLILVLIAATFHDNFSFVLQSLDVFYNDFLSKTRFISSIRSLAWILKIFGEMVIPIWNFLIRTAVMIIQDLILLIAQNDTTQEDAKTIAIHSGKMFSELSSSALSWINVQRNCRYSVIYQDIDINTVSIPCLQHEHREFDMEIVFQSLQIVVITLIKVAISLCPIGSSIFDTMLYPLKDPMTGKVLHSVFNVMLQVVYDIWDTTQLRCRIAIRTRKSISLCVPDAEPLFIYFHDILDSLGELLDNWLQKFSDLIFSLFMQKETDDFVSFGIQPVSSDFVKRTFGGNFVKFLRLTPSTSIFTDGVSVFYDSNIGNGRRLIENAFSPIVDLKHGIAPIVFMQSLDDVDVDGLDTTSILGCSCKMVSNEMKITCSVAHFSQSRLFLGLEDEIDTSIPVYFEQSSSAQYLTCDTVQISVQPVRYPQLSMDVMDERIESRQTRINEAASECLRDPRKCNNVDAIIYVKPLCVRDKAWNVDGSIKMTETFQRNRNRMACTSDFEFQPCYPYCIGAHYKGSGNYGIYLYGKRTLENGIFKSNTVCSALEQAEATEREIEQYQILPDQTFLQDLDLSTLEQENVFSVSCTLRTQKTSVEISEEFLNRNNFLDFATLNTAQRSFEWSDLQPFLVAGDTVLIPQCQQKGSECKWTVSLMRLTSSVFGQYRMMPILTSIPAQSASAIGGGWQNDYSTQSDVIRIPYSTMDATFADRNIAVQTRTGIFYAVNPDLDTIPLRMTRCANCPSHAQTEFSDISQFRGPRIFLTRPRFECQRGSLSDAIKLYHDEQEVRGCTQNLTREVEFTGSDIFWNSNNLEGLFQNKRTVNLFVYDMSLYDEVNVLVSVVHGRVDNIKFDVGIFSKTDGSCEQKCYEDPDRFFESELRFYYVHVRTLQIKLGSPWRAESIQQRQRLVPDLFTLLTKSMIIFVHVLKTIVNEYIVNLIGIVEQYLRADGVINVGKNLEHHAFEIRKNGYPPLSFRDSMDQVTIWSNVFDKTVMKSTRYVSLFMGLDIGMAKQAYSGVLVLFYFSKGIMLTSINILHYFWDDILLPFILARVRIDARGEDTNLLVTANNVIYDSIVQNRMRQTVLVPSSMLCNRLPQVTLDPAGPTGSLLLHGCHAAVEGFHFLVTMFFTLTTFSKLNTCICQVGGSSSLGTDLDIQKCVRELPVVLQDDYRAYWMRPEHRIGRNRIHNSLCQKNVNRFRQHLTKLPNKFLTRVDLALDALNNVPTELGHIFGVGNRIEEEWSCSANSFMSSSDITSLIPQPVEAFERCAFTKTCQQKCSTDIQLFYIEMAKVENPNVQFSSSFNSIVPVTNERVLGMRTENFRPLVVQDYGPHVDSGCDRYIVVVGRENIDEYKVTENQDFVLYRLCEHMNDQDAQSHMKLLGSPIPLQRSHEFMRIEDAEGDHARQVEHQTLKHQIIDMFLPHKLANNALASVFISAWYKGMSGNGVFRIDVLRDGTQRSDWILTSLSFSLSTLSAQCNFAKAAGMKLYNDETSETEEVEIKINTEANVDVSDPQRSSYDAIYPDNPYFAQILLVPGLYGSDISAEVGLIVKLKMKVSTFDRPERLHDIEFVVYLGLNDFGVKDDVCFAELYSTRRANVQNSLVHLLQKHEMRGSRFIIEELPDAEDCAFAPQADLWCKDFALAYLSENGNGVEKESFVLNVQNNSVTFGPHQALMDEAQCDLSYCQHGRQYGKIVIANTNIMTGFGFDFKKMNEYSRDPFSPLFTFGARLLSLGIADQRASQLYSMLSCSYALTNSRMDWLQETRVYREAGTWQLSTSSGFMQTRQVNIVGDCNYMSCGECAGLSLQRMCYAAQDCAIQKCVGTVINQNNIFCVVGSVVKEAIEFVAVDARVAWSGFVEIYMGIFEFAQGRIETKSLAFESLSNYYVSKMCESKDIVAALASVIPSLVSSIYLIMVQSTEKSSFLTKSDRDFISPQNKLRMRALTTYISEIFYQISLSIVFYIFSVQKLIICGADQVAELTGGFINIVSNDIGNEHSNICIFNSGSHTRNDMPTDAEIIKTRMQIESFEYDPGMITRIQRNSKNVITNVVTSFGSSAASLRKIAKNYRRFMFLNQLNTIVDWVVGLLYSVSRLTAAFDPAECRPRASYTSSLTQCVCGDKPYEITSMAASASVSEGGLWCSGILEMVSQNGLMIHIYNPYSFSFLKDKLDNNQNGESLTQRYLKCVDSVERTEDMSECKILETQIKQADGQNIFTGWMRDGINPISVLTKCRNNFHSKQWDVGQFAIYNEEIQEKIYQYNTGVTEEQITALQTLINKETIGLETVQCLKLGPNHGDINRCMFLYFEHKASTENMAQSFFNFFEYEPMLSDVGRGHDACLFLSTEDFQRHPKFGSIIQTCLQETSDTCRSAETSNNCRLYFGTRTLESASTSNMVNTFNSLATTGTTQMQQTHEHIQRCAQDLFQDVLQKLTAQTSQNPLLYIDFELDSFEGDLLHQQVDCIFQGPYNQILLQPADIEGLLENLPYSRDPAGQSRDFEIPCEEKTLTSNLDGTQHKSHTCGTPARMAAMAYVKDQFRNREALNQKIQALIIAKIVELKNDFEDQSLYSCSHACCLEWTSSCEEESVDFNPQIQAQLEVDVTNIILDNENIQDIQFTAINDAQVRFFDLVI